ncbi:hypothetical protein ABZW32_21100, partial [Streptomyces sp. NPDC004667]|uniref:hypothetical protein n=1 Tax=Streptomyces sp. NPDC004667 TaxID=3154285 RepID=UPI0033AA520A
MDDDGRFPWPGGGWIRGGAPTRPGGETLNNVPTGRPPSRTATDRTVVRRVGPPEPGRRQPVPALAGAGWW